MIHTHNTVPTQFVEANGIRFAYRRFGKAGADHIRTDGRQRHRLHQGAGPEAS